MKEYTQIITWEFQPISIYSFFLSRWHEHRSKPIVYNYVKMHIAETQMTKHRSETSVSGKFQDPEGFCDRSISRNFPKPQ